MDIGHRWCDVLSSNICWGIGSPSLLYSVVCSPTTTLWKLAIVIQRWWKYIQFRPGGVPELNSNMSCYNLRPDWRGYCDDCSDMLQKFKATFRHSSALEWFHLCTFSAHSDFPVACFSRHGPRVLKTYISICQLLWVNITLLHKGWEEMHLDTLKSSFCEE